MRSEKKTPEDWSNAITTKRNNRGKDVWYTAMCPICCVISDNISVHRSEGSAEILAKTSVLSHIKSAHPELVIKPRDAGNAQSK